MTTKTKRTTGKGFPKWDAASRRWWLYIGSQHGRDGRRVPKRFWWPASADDFGNTPAAGTIAAAVERRNGWREIVIAWPQLSRRLAAAIPGRDWSKPVWFDPELLAKIEADERSVIDEAMAKFAAEEEAREAHEADQAARWFAANGLAALITAMRAPFSPRPMNMPAAFQAKIAERVETGRVTALAELEPLARRAMVKPACISDAVQAFLASQAKRVECATSSRAIEKVTNQTVAERLRAAFGQSSNPELPPIRATPIAFDLKLSFVTKELLEQFAHYWHCKPDGVKSDRRVKNVLEAARQFFVWCADQPEYGWTFPASCRPLLTADNVRREAAAFDPSMLCQIVKAGGPRTKMYVLLGLTCGYYQKDIAGITGADLLRIGDDTFIQRLRSKERRVKRGRRPLKVRHWIAPELAELIEAERGRNALGTLFNSQQGTPLVARTVEGAWDTACSRAKARLMFCQLRKIGYNGIKRHGGEGGPLKAEFWEGHAGGGTKSSVVGSYDDGVWPEMNDAERLWAAELREHGIL